MIKVTVTNPAVRNQSGNAKSTGKPYSLNFQEVWLHTWAKDGTINPFPEKVEIILDKDASGAPLYYPVGEYVIDPSSIYVRNGDAHLGIRLRPAKSAAPAAKPAA